MNYQLDPHTKTLSLTIPGDILSSSANRLWADLSALLESEPVRDGGWDVLKLDLSAAKMVDSAGLNLLVALLRAPAVQGKKVQATVSNLNVHRTFVFTRLDQKLELIKV
jgi:ABC-type transporter Mla MlaB component